MSTVSNLANSPSLATSDVNTHKPSTPSPFAGLKKSVNELGNVNGSNGNNAAAISLSNPRFGDSEKNGAASASAIFKNFLG